MIPQTIYGISKNFGVEIVADNAKQLVYGDNKYISVPNKTPYSIRFINHTSTKADVAVTIDGESVGKWRLDKYSKILIERPANVNRKFIFVSETSEEATQAGIEKGNSDNGLIKVTFYPEYPPTILLNDMRAKSFSNNISSGMQMMNVETDSIRSHAKLTSYSSGGTVLGGETKQQFNTVTPIRNIDNSRVETIVFRLVVDNNHKEDNQKPFISLKEANAKVPPRIENLL